MTPAVLRFDFLRDVGLVAEVGSADRWYRVSSSGFEELIPERDEALSLSHWLCAGRSYQVLSYRPRRRLVVSYSQSGRAVVEKGYRRRRSGLAARRHRLAADALSGTAVRAPRVLGCRPDRESVLFERLAGVHPELSRQSVGVFGALGAGLRELQRAQVGACLPVFGATDELGVLDSWRGRLGSIGADLPEDWLSLRESVERSMSGLRSIDPVPTHRDLHDRQVLVDGGRVTLLDFDLFCLASPALDPANLLAELEVRRLQSRGEIEEADLTALGNAFFEGYGSRDPLFDEWFRVYRITSLLRLALVYGARPPWAGVVPGLMASAQRCAA